MWKHNLRDNTGSAFVELALIVPTLVLMVIGAAELGRIGYAAVEVSNAARAGVAYGAQSATVDQDFPNMQLAARDDAPNLNTLVATATGSCVCEAVTSSTGAIKRTAISVCSGPAATIPTDCGTSKTAGVTNYVVNYVQVSTTATVTTMFHYPGIPASFTLHGLAKMRVEDE
jgi:Flp pilus assembly protein TadG